MNDDGDQYNESHQRPDFFFVFKLRVVEGKGQVKE